MKRIIILFAILPLLVLSQDKEPKKMQGMLKAHNKYRKALGLPNLIWSNTLAANAQKWANHLKDQNCSIRHSPKKSRIGYGENIAWNSGYNDTPEGVVDRWCSEQENFNFETRKCNGNWQLCGHYTQVIWRATERVGCAVVQCGNQQVWVCQYDPAGNINVTKGNPAY